MADLLKTQISNHPLYPNLVSAYIECQKVGAPPEMASLLEEISRVNHPFSTQIEIGADPELDEFMESYCEILQRLKEELSRPLDEATTFLNNIESQLSSLCRGEMMTYSFENDQTHSDEANAGTSEEDMSCNIEVGAYSKSIESSSVLLDKDLKDFLLRKYGGYLSNLRKEFLKKRKKGKLPKEARMTLLAWWNSHYRWPYPTEEEKTKLSEVTGLDQKQINNWFINQRKRHWKPSEDMRLTVMEDVSGNINRSMFFDT